MDERLIAREPVQAEGIEVAWAQDLAVGVLRHAEPGDALLADLTSKLGVPVPAALQAVSLPVDRFEAPAVLVWSRPTETLLVGARGLPFDQVSAACRKLSDGIFIDQSDGICVLRVRGARTRDLLVRLGDSNSVPVAGEAKRSRLGDLPVLTVGRGDDGVWLIVDRVYREHLLSWISETAADLEGSGARIRDN